MSTKEVQTISSIERLNLSKEMDSLLEISGQPDKYLEYADELYRKIDVIQSECISIAKSYPGHAKSKDIIRMLINSSAKPDEVRSVIKSTVELGELTNIVLYGLSLIKFKEHLLTNFIKNYSEIKPLGKEDRGWTNAAMYLICPDGKIRMNTVDFLKLDLGKLEEMEGFNSIDDIIKSKSVDRLNSSKFNVYNITTQSKKITPKDFNIIAAVYLQERFLRDNPHKRNAIQLSSLFGMESGKFDTSPAYHAEEVKDLGYIR